MVGRGQPDVVERLSALELDLAELAQGHPARPRPSARCDAGEGTRRQRLPGLRPRHCRAAGRRRPKGASGRLKMVTVTIKQMVTVAIFLFLAILALFGAAQSGTEARKEGALTLYTSNAAPTIQALSTDFEKRYCVRVNVWRASSVKVLQRLLAEKKAGRWEFDAVSVSAPELEALYREDLLQPVDSSAHRELLEGTLPPHRGWAPQFINVFVQAYNSAAIRTEQLPRRWADLLDERWKGKLGVEANASEWYCTVLGTLGERQGADLFRRIASTNGLSVRHGNSVLANMVVSGEVPLALAVYSHMIDEAKAQGAPVDWFALEPLVARVNGVGISRQPPHPQAARLYYDYLLTDAQPILAKLHYVSPRQDLPSPLRGAKLVFAEAQVDARCENAYAALLKAKGE